MHQCEISTVKMALLLKRHSVKCFILSPDSFYIFIEVDYSRCLRLDGKMLELDMYDIYRDFLEQFWVG